MPKVRSVDKYLAALPPNRRQVLEHLRQLVKATLPDVEEVISYQLPAFRLRGKILLAYGSSAKHCALYPMAPDLIETFAAELADYSTSKGTIRFQPSRPLPDDLIRRIALARAASLDG